VAVLPSELLKLPDELGPVDSLLDDPVYRPHLHNDVAVLIPTID
jgi:hypothetical protein